MDKNSIIGFILIAAIFLGFTFYQRSVNKKYADNLATSSETELVASSIQSDIDEAQINTPSDSENETVNPSFYKDSLLDLSYNAKAQIITLENDKLKIDFTTKGAQPYSVQIKDFTNFDKSDLYIVKPGQGDYSFSIYTGEYIQTRDFSFEVTEHSDSTIVMRLPFSNGGYIQQKYILHQGEYLVDNQLSFVDMDTIIPRNVSSFDIDFNLIIPRMEKGYKNESRYSKMNYYFDGDKKPEEMGQGRSANKRIDSRLNWFSYQQQFFCAIMRAPNQFSSGELSVNFLGDVNQERNLMSCSAKMRSELNRGKEVVVPFEFYFGPNHYNTLASYQQKYEKIIPLGGWLVGWFTRFAIIPMFNFFNRFIGSFGLIILLMTIVIKTVVLPLTYKSYASSAKMAALKPEIEKINAKYPHFDNKAEQMKKQQATMDLYKRAGASPMSGCLPTLLTLPILWAMFRFFPASIELRGQSFLWCDDLSSYDSIINFGTRVPLIGDHLSLFALLMAITMWVYSKFTMKTQPNANDPNAASMRFMSLWMMPIMMFFICNNLSAALSYYYLLSQLISIVQIWIIRKSIKPEAVLAKVKNSEGKPVQKSKWQLKLEEAQKLQEQQLREQQKKMRR